MKKDFQLAKAELQKLPYVKHLPSDGRSVPLLGYYDDVEADWHLYAEVREGELGRLRGGEVVVGTYLSGSPAQPDDFELPLGTFVVRHLSFPKVLSAAYEFTGDVSHLSAVLAKYEMISAVRRRSGTEATILAASEVEYLLVLVRSIYDQLQRVSSESAKLVHALDESKRKAFSPLPKSFADVVIDKGRNGRLRTAEEIMEKWGLTEALARFYVAEGPSFKLVRSLRDDIVHYGAQVPWVFNLEEGLATGIDAPPWSRLPIWKPELLRNKRLGSLRAVFAYLAKKALEATASYAGAFVASVAVPPALNPDVCLYLRGPFTDRLVRLDHLLAEPWEGESESAQSSAATA